MTDHYLDSSTTQNLKFSLLLKNLIKKYKEKCPSGRYEKRDYIVMGCPLHTKTPNLSVFLRKTFNPARMNWGGIFKKS